MIRYKAADGWKRAQAARSAKASDFQYQVRYYVGRNVKYESAGKDANQAETLRRRIEHQESVKAEAVKAGVRIEPNQTRKTLAATAAEYIRDAELRNADEAALQARNVTEEFIRTVRKTYLDELTRNDVLGFHAALRKRGCGDRTVANKHNRLKSWFLFAGVDRTVLPPRPRYEEKLPTKYTSDEHSSILGAADPYMHLAIGLALKCGLRDQEIIFLEWADIDEDAKVVQVRGKEKYHFRVKDSEQRELPIPDDLLAELKSWKQAHGGKGLVLPTKSDRPNRKLLEHSNGWRGQPSSTAAGAVAVRARLRSARNGQCTSSGVLTPPSCCRTASI